jgi:hypothetical protein
VCQLNEGLAYRSATYTEPFTEGFLTQRLAFFEAPGKYVGAQAFCDLITANLVCAHCLSVPDLQKIGYNQL